MLSNIFEEIRKFKKKIGFWSQSIHRISSYDLKQNLGLKAYKKRKTHGISEASKKKTRDLVASSHNAGTVSLEKI